MVVLCCLLVRRPCVPTTFFGDVDISKVSGCHLLQKMSSQRGSPKLLQGLVSLKHTVHLSVFDMFLT